MEPSDDSLQARLARRDGTFDSGKGLERLMKTFPNGMGEYLRRTADSRGENPTKRRGKGDKKVPSLPAAGGPSMDAIMAARSARKTRNAREDLKKRKVHRPRTSP